MLEDGTPTNGADAGTDPRHLRLVERLGEGSYGVVFRAVDPHSGAELAVKTLRDADPNAVARFKREFRALADVHHPNLATLHQLAFDRDRWMFSMELVRGLDLLRWVELGSRAFDRDAETPADPPAQRHERLREALLQVVEGLAALHGAGHLHRDLKPSNILVTREGRVVILDFGLVDDLHPATRMRIIDMAGSPAYMSPEQSAGAPCSEASDWYAMGVVLFEALTGQLPFDGPSRTILHRKQTEEAPDVRGITSDAPEDLTRLCSELLQRNADRRPGLDRIRNHLTGEPTGVFPSPSGVDSFTGRARELETLLEGLRGLRGSPRPRLACVEGPSGMGKTVLLRRFASIAEGRRTVVLAGRCFQQEAVPYKGMDGVIDALAQYLRTLGDDEVGRILPEDVGLLARLFPVLGQVPAIAVARLAMARPPDPQRLREVAFEALATLLHRIAERRPVVAIVDDAHWADSDSADLLRHLLSREGAPRILWVMSHRDPPTESGPMVGICIEAADRDLAVDHVLLGPLDDEDARTLAQERLGSGSDAAMVERVIREAAGVPFFLTQLLAHAATTGQAASTNLNETLDARLSTMPEHAARFLQAACLFGRPVPGSWTWRVAAEGPVDAGLTSALRHARLLRTAGSRDGALLIEPYHDRIRDLVVRSLPAAERRRLHAAWSGVLEEQGSDFELLAYHLEGAGDGNAAARALASAATEATRVFAWERAARLYGRAAELQPASPDARRWRHERAHALANAGRGDAAAEHYLALAASARGDERDELRRQAAEQLLRAGRMDEGFGVLRQVLHASGLRFPSGSVSALTGLLHQRGRLRLRGLSRASATRRPPNAKRLRRIDTCLSASVGMGGVDSLRGAYFHSLALRMALDCGEPRRLARALAFEAAFQSNRGAAGRARAEALIAETRREAQRLEDPYLNALIDSARAVAAFHVGEWQHSIEVAERAVTALRERCVGVAKETVTIQLFALSAMAQRGRYRALSERLSTWLDDAQRRGDVYAATNLRTGLPNLAWLARDDDAEAERQADDAMEDWQSSGFLIPNFFDLLARTEIDLYRGRPQDALHRLRDTRPAMRASMLEILQVVRVLHRDAWGRACLMTASTSSSGAGRALDRARRHGRALVGENVGWARALGRRLLGGVAANGGDRAAARAHLHAAAIGFSLSGMDAHAATSRWAMAALASGSGDARHSIEREREALASFGVRAPERFLVLHVPGTVAAP